MLDRLFVRGDTHGDFEFLKDFCKEYNTTKKDTLIILGDSGINYYESERDYAIKRFIEDLPITLFCIHGNHEKRPQECEKSKYELNYFSDYQCNCWIEHDYPSILFPVDGAAVIKNKKFLILGGAYSVDKFYRLSKGWKWFSSEQMNENNRQLMKNIVDKDPNWDYVLSHTAPIDFEPTYLFLSFIDQSKVDKTMENFLQQIYNKLNKEVLKQWYFAHYHDDAVLGDKIRICYNQIIEIFD